MMDWLINFLILVGSMISKFIEFILTTLERLNNLPNLLQGIGIALLTILVPLAIAILSDFYQKRKDQEIEFSNLDIHVILDYVFKIKRLLIYTALIFLPTFLWEISSGLFRFVEITLSSIGIYLTINIILGVYRWTKGNVFEPRFSYLKNLRNYNDMEIVWRSVWQTEKINTQNEVEFFKIFSSNNDQLLKNNENLKTLSKLLNDFSNFINKRSIVFLVMYDEVFPKILEWHFKIWQKKKEESKRPECHTISRILDFIIETIVERALREGESYWLFRYLEKHSRIYKNEHKYLKHLFSIFYRTFFEKVRSSPEHCDIWEHYFPQRWKITKSNLENKENVISRILLEQFGQWASERIWKSKEELDPELDDVSWNLFPEVEPILWSAILIFSLSPYEVKSIIERPWNFGYRIRAGDIESATSQQKSEERNTFELAAKIFPDKFSKENLESYIKDLEGLKYKEDSLEERNRAKLLYIFTEMLKMISK